MKRKENHGRILNGHGEIDLVAVGHAIWDRILLVILAVIFATTLAAVLTNAFIAPTYQSSFTAFVNNKSDPANQTSVSNTDTSASASLANTYAEILQSRPVLEATTELSGQNFSYGEMKKMVTAKVESSTQLVSVTVTAPRPEKAYYLAKTISEITPGYMADIVEGSSMKIVSKPTLNLDKVGPSAMKNSVIGGLLGLILAVVVILIVEITDKRIRNPQELEDRFGISVIGVIPFFESFEEKQ